MLKYHNKFGLLSLAIVVLLVVAATFSNYWWQKHIEKEHLLKIYVPLISDVVESFVSNSNQQIKISSEQVFKIFSAQPENRTNKENILSLLKASLSHSSYDYVYYISQIGKPTRYFCYQDTCDSEELNFDKPYDIWFNAFIDNGEEHSVAIARTPHREKKVFFNNFLFREGEANTYAAFGTGFYITSHITDIFKSKTDLPIHINIMNEFGELFLDTVDSHRTPLLFKNLAIEHLQELWEKSGMSHNGTFVSEKGNYIFASEYLINISTTGVSNQHWYLIISLDKERFFAKSTPVLFVNGALGLGYLILFMLTVGKKFKRYDQELQLEAKIDKLTGKPNRKMLVSAFETFAIKVNKNEEQYAFVIFDLDKFKPINDTHGHIVGDKILIEFSNRVSSALRDDDIFGRLGGDEFVCLLRITTEQADKIMLRIQHSVESLPFKLPNGQELFIRFSYGLEIMEAGKSFDEVYTCADEKLYLNKRGK